LKFFILPEFKTYETIGKKEQELNFAISKMEDVFQKRKGMKDEPHRHNFYTILVVENAVGKHIIDFNAYDLGEHQVFFIAPGQVHQVIENKPSKGFVVTFSNQFLIENAINVMFIERLNLFNNYGQNPPLLPDEDRFNTIIDFCQKIFKLYQSDERLKAFSIGAYLKLLLIECNSICQLHPFETNAYSSEDLLVKEFKSKVNTHFRKEHSTQFYANALNITSDYLNKKIKAKIGKTAKEYIQTRIITEAKRLLYFTKKNNKEIGYELGFNEPSNFSHFFKNCTSMSPSAFKKFSKQNPN